MGLTSTPLDSRFSDVAVSQTAATGTADADVFGGAKTIYSVHINNASSNVVYVKFYDDNTGNDSTAPVLIFEVPNGATMDVTMPDGIAFATGVSWRCVQEAGTSGGTSPAGGNVLVEAVGS